MEKLTAPKGNQLSGLNKVPRLKEFISKRPTNMFFKYSDPETKEKYLKHQEKVY